MSNKPMISIVIPTYNRVNYIETNLKILTLQSCSNFEVVVVDDGSSQDVFSVCKNFENVLDLKYIRQRDVPWNQAVAKNLGIKLSSSDVLFIVDDDAFLMPTCLQEHVNAHRQHDKVMVFGEVLLCESLNPNDMFDYINKNKYPEGGRIRSFRMLQQNFSVKKKHVLEINGYDEDFAGRYGYEDKNFWDRLGLLGCQVHQLNEAKSVAILGDGHNLARDRKTNYELYKRKLEEREVICKNGIEKL